MNTESSMDQEMPAWPDETVQAEWQQFIALIQDIIGIPFPRERAAELARHVRDMTAALGFSHQHDFVRWFLNDANQARRIELLAKQLTIGETYFFRDEKNFRLLNNEILPQLQRTGRSRVTLWSAGCSSGEEPYTMAMMMHMAPLPALEVQIVASDINPNALDKARTGIYSGWSFRNPPPGVQDRYFTRLGANQFQIVSHIQQQVLFLQVNLVADHYPPPLDQPAAVDILFCRNVLMYFTPEKRAQIIDRFCTLLVDDGWLIVSPSEAALVQHARLAIDRPAEPNVFRKQLARPAARPAPPPVTPPSAPPVMTGRRARAVTPGTLPVPGRRPPARPTDHLPVDAVLEQARKLFNDKKLTEAADLLTGCLNRGHHPDRSAGPGPHPEAIALLAQIQANLGQLDQAEESYRRAIAVDRLQADHYYHLAMIRLEKNRPDEAVALLEKALFLQPDLVIAHLQLAGLYQDKRQVQRCARNVVDLLASADPDAIVPGADGLTVAAIRQMAQRMTRA
ncbi:MAG: tetratricopeptide repeat protein [Magnetococcus sp. DMHC-8]